MEVQLLSRAHSIVFYPSAAESRFPVIVASEYIEGGDAASADGEVKVGLATSLGTLLLRPGRFRPHIEAFARDMFKVRRDRTGTDGLVLIDVDPYIDDQESLVRSTEGSKDIWYSAYITKVSDLLWGWSKPEERKATLSAFINSLRLLAKDLDSPERERTFNAFIEAHSMAQGLDLRGFQL